MRIFLQRATQSDTQYTFLQIAYILGPAAGQEASGSARPLYWLRLDFDFSSLYFKMFLCAKAMQGASNSLIVQEDW